MRSSRRLVTLQCELIPCWNRTEIAQCMPGFTELLSSCKHPHRCNQMLFNCCFHTAVSFCCVYFVTERKARIYIYIFIQTPLSAVCVFFSWIASRRAELHSFATAPHWSNRSIAGSCIRSYEIKRLLDNKNICRQFFIVDVVDNVD